MPYPALLTDLYELTMLAGYFDEGMHEKPATFDLFFRENPFRGGYAVFAGLESALRYLKDLRFGPAELAYLEGLGLFKPSFLDYLRAFRFRGSVMAPPEGTVVFGHEPVLTVDGPLAEAQFVETALLNIVNYQTLVATKAARIRIAAGDRPVIEFGLRRAQGPDGGLSATRAAYVGGVRATSNLWAGHAFGVPVKGTHAHSWVMAFPDELTAFRAYAKSFPDNCVLLVDTYDTLGSGIPHALIVARELRAAGHELLGVRLDSGDLTFLSKQTRQRFDVAGFPGVKIVASNELDEYVIQSMRNEGAPIDIWGVGTRLVTCAGDGGGALGGVYKLVHFDGEPRIKVTSDIAKSTVPDRKELLRVLGADGRFQMDVMCREGEPVGPGTVVSDPTNPSRHKAISPNARFERVHRTMMEAGKIVEPPPPLDVLADRCEEQLARLPEGTLRLVNPHRYKVSMSPQLHALREQLMSRREALTPLT